jgi:hypothetical protein
VTIVPDTKDWTWVLRRPCPECGFDARSFARERVSEMLLAGAAAWRAVLAGSVPAGSVPAGSVPAESGDLRRRSRPDRWSPLEYACHVRDVFRLYAERLDLMLTRDAPHFPNWDQDATAVAERYGEQDPARVAEELTAAADRLAADFAAVSGDAWQRTGARGDGADFTVESFARYFIHDPVHHLHDVTGGWSPRIRSVSWGRMEVEGLGAGKDFRLYPGGGREWDWAETGMRHSPGIQPADVAELLAYGATAVVLSRGMQERLEVDPRTLEALDARSVTVHVAETRAAVAVYNGLVDDGVAVAGLFHSTC